MDRSSRLRHSVVIAIGLVLALPTPGCVGGANRRVDVDGLSLTREEAQDATATKALPVPTRAPDREFDPRRVSLSREPFGPAQTFRKPQPAPQQVALAHPEPAVPEASAKQSPPPTGPIGRFRAKLAALETDKRADPVTIVHIGDSHIASDSFTSGIRSRLQSRFGDAGRGAVIPGNAFKYAAASGVSMRAAGAWQSSMSLRKDKGPFGISGVRVDASSSSARLSLKASERFDWAAVTVATGPGRGDFEVTVDGQTKRFSSAAAQAGAATFRVDRAGSTLDFRPVGNGVVSLLYWSTGLTRPGIRYVNFGQVGATVNVTRKWDDRIVAENLGSLKPDLIIYGFGTNEGYDDNSDPAKYKSYVRDFLGELAQAAPQADFLILGASDGLRRKGGKSCGNGWYIPPRLPELRDAMHELAGEMNAGWWDWSKAMGGSCSIDQWARTGLARGDHVHLTPQGYDRSAASLVDYLTGGAKGQMVLARKQSGS